MNDELQKILDQTVEVTETLPERYREIAFSALLRYFLTSSSKSHIGISNQKQIKDHDSSSESDDGNMVSDLPEAHVIAENGNRAQETMWAALTISARGDEVTTESIMRCIKVELGKSPQKGTNTSTTLKNLTPKYLSRTKAEEGSGYTYEPTKNAFRVFEGLEY